MKYVKTKKVKDVTIGELHAVCKRVVSCIYCPLKKVCFIEINKAKKRELEDEVEVPEELLY